MKLVMIVVAMATGLTCTTAGAQGESKNALFKHPVLEHKIDEKQRPELERAIAPLMELSDEELVALVPTQTPLIKHGCPACRKGKSYDKDWDNATAKMFDYHWDYKKPDQIQCKTCQMVFPNKQFPMDRTELFHSPAGRAVEIPYYFDPDKTVYALPGQTGGKTGRRYYLNGVIDYAKWQWLFPRLQSLTKLYHLTGDEKYARPAVLILRQYGLCFRDYLLTTDYGHTYATAKGKKLPYGWVETRWGRRAPEENMIDLLEVLDLVYESEAMTQIGAESGVDTRELLWSVFESGLKRRLHYGYDNWFGQSPGAKDVLPLAKVFGKIDLIHLVFQTYYDLPRYTYASDGSFFEGTGYAAIQCLSTARLREEDGYSDPASYRGSDRLDDMYPFVGREAFYRKAYGFLDDLRYPDGKKVVIQDAGPISGIFQNECPRAASQNMMKPGYKHLIMGDGTADDQIQVHVGFGDNSANHSRQDTLGLQMYAFAHPLIDAFPYHKSKLRTYSNMTITHNTVVVDHRNQHKNYSDADPLLYVDDLPGLCAFSADGARAYRGVASKYKRTLVLNTIDLKRPYLIDVFQVAGGKTHDFVLRSSSMFPQSARASAAMAPMAGIRPLLPADEKWQEPVGQGQSVGSGYGLFFDVKRAAVEPGFHIDFVCDTPWDVKPTEPKPQEWNYIPYRFDPASWPENADVGNRHHIVGQAGQEVFLAQTPALNRMGFYGDGALPSEKWKHMPVFIVRSEAADGKSESLIVVVHEPFYDKPAIKSVDRVDVGNTNVLMLEIQFNDGRRDRFVYSLDMQPARVKHRDLEFEGIMGLVAGGVSNKSDGYLIGGRVLKANSGKVDLRTDAARYTGEVVGSARTWDGLKDENSFTVRTNMELPEGKTLAGQWIILKHHGQWDAYEDRRAIRRYPRDGASSAWGLNDEHLWQTFYKDIESEIKPVERLRGGGYCFQIARIEKRNGQTVIHTTDDHGMIVKNGITQEYFYPCRTYEGKTTFEIHPAVATQGIPIVSPPGGTFMDSVTVTCSVRGSSNKIMVAKSKPGAQPDASEWREYRGPVRITEDTDLHVKSSAADALGSGKVFTYSFTAPMKPVLGKMDLASGLIRKTHVTKASLEPGGAPDSVDIVTTVDAADLVGRIDRNHPGKQTFSGMLRIDKGGVYTFHFLADRDGIFRIGDKELLPSRPRFHAYPLARPVEVALEKGLYPISFELIIAGCYSRWDPALKLEWSGPGFERQVIPGAHYLHDKQMVAK